MSEQQPPDSPDTRLAAPGQGPAPDEFTRALTERAAYWTTLPTATRRDRALISQCMGGDTRTHDDVTVWPLWVKDVLIHPAETIDPETGEVKRWPRTVLVLADGLPVSYGSVVVARECLRILRGERQAGDASPVPIVIRRKKLQMGSTYSVAIDITALVDAPKKGGKGNG